MPRADIPEKGIGWSSLCRDTRLGKLKLRIPKLRHGSYFRRSIVDLGFAQDAAAFGQPETSGPTGNAQGAQSMVGQLAPSVVSREQLGAGSST
ncbi:MAG: hypothetical protein JOZ17_05860 [Acetobacteraceae bacterium]|nr:hypothetical protein [Acetobacteraceae bacterium]